MIATQMVNFSCQPSALHTHPALAARTQVPSELMLNRMNHATGTLISQAFCQFVLSPLIKSFLQTPSPFQILLHFENHAADALQNFNLLFDVAIGHKSFHRADTPFSRQQRAEGDERGGNDDENDDLGNNRQLRLRDELL